MLLIAIEGLMLPHAPVACKLCISALSHTPAYNRCFSPADGKWNCLRCRICQEKLSMVWLSCVFAQAALLNATCGVRFSGQIVMVRVVLERSRAEGLCSRSAADCALRLFSRPGLDAAPRHLGRFAGGLVHTSVEDATATTARPSRLAVVSPQ